MCKSCVKPDGYGSECNLKQNQLQKYKSNLKLYQCSTSPSHPDYNQSLKIPTYHSNVFRDSTPHGPHWTRSYYHSVHFITHQPMLQWRGSIGGFYLHYNSARPQQVALPICCVILLYPSRNYIHTFLNSGPGVHTVIYTT